MTKPAIASSANPLSEPDASDASATTDYLRAWHDKPSDLLTPEALAELNARSDRKGWQQFILHLMVLVGSGTVWGLSWGSIGQLWWLALPALVLYGFSLAAMFAPLHECVHRTAFASRRLNDAVAWLAGVFSFYNSTFFRRYHKWHHRYTRVLGKDPEYEDAQPTSWRVYLWLLSGIPWWLGKIRGYGQMALGRFEDCPYIAEAARAEVVRSVRWQLGVYGGAIALSLVFQQPWFVVFWLLPLAVGQPILRFILMAEHTGCTKDDNPLTNTRTTLTLWPLRVLMWNMGFHGEHHLYASIPFHALPEAHRRLGKRFAYVSSGYGLVNRQVIAKLVR